MLGPPVDAWYAFIALSIVSTVIAGVSFDLSAAAAPSATPAAETVDAVAAGPAPSIGHHPLAADRVRIESTRIAVDRGGTIDTARYRFGPVVPVIPGTPLATVLNGAPPEHVFDSEAKFDRALGQAQAHESRWQDVDAGLTVRAVAWNETNATLVGVRS
ncbi:MAG: hypothetical protein ACLFR6_07380 [Salinarchaeum sp.]